MALIAVGILLVFLYVRSKAKRLAHCFYLVKPHLLIVRNIKYLFIFRSYCRRILGSNIFGESIIFFVGFVIKIAYKKVSFLFTGDAEKSEESDIIKSGKNLKSDVLKVGHHGSTTSNTYKFLKCVSPKYAVISGVPKEKIVTRLNSFCEKIYRTDKDGTVKAYSDGENINFKTEKSVA